MLNLLPLILLAGGGIILTFGDIIMKKWVSTNHFYFFFVGLAVYLIGLIFLAQSFKFKNIAVASLILVIFNIISLSLVSWLYFKEKLSAGEIFGLGLGILAIIVLELSKK